MYIKKELQNYIKEKVKKVYPKQVNGNNIIL